MSDTMAAVTVTPGQKDSLRVRRDVPAPRPSAEDTVVRVLETGVCGTDEEIQQGLYGQAPPGSDYLVLGHENLGRVDSAPAGSGLQAGALVVSTVRRPCPERCRACAADQNDMCLTGHFSERGIRGRHGFMSEAYSESSHFLVPIPARLRGVAVLLEPLSIVEKGVEQALRVYQRVPWHPRRAVVLGAGAVGLLAAIALRLRGLEVHVVSRNPEGGTRDLLLRDAGIQYSSTRTHPLETVAQRLGPIDVVFEATGMVGPDGVCVLTSVTGGEHRMEVDIAALNRELVLRNAIALGTVNAARPHFEAGVRDMETAEDRFPGWLERAITRRIGYDDAQKAMKRGPDDIKTVLEFAA